MADNREYEHGGLLSLPVPENTASGDPVQVGGINGVALTDRGAGGNDSDKATVQCRPSGVFRLEVTGAVTDVGQPVYFDAGDIDVDDATGSNDLYGYALDTKGAAPSVIRVKLA